MGRRTNPETERLVCELWNRGASYREMREQAGVGSDSTIRAILDRNGAARRYRQATTDRQSLQACVMCKRRPADDGYVLCVHCRAVTALRRDMVMRRVRRA